MIKDYLLYYFNFNTKYNRFFKNIILISFLLIILLSLFIPNFISHERTESVFDDHQDNILFSNVKSKVIEKRCEIAFIDKSVPDYKKLINSINPSIDVFILGNNPGGFCEIAKILKRYAEVDAIHIFSHGGKGEILFSSGNINSTNIVDNSNYLKCIKSALNKNGDILLYGCDIGKSTSFIEQISYYTNADIASSNDKTGNYCEKTDWALEVNKGYIEPHSVFLGNEIFNYNGILSEKTNQLDFSDIFNADVVKSDAGDAGDFDGWAAFITESFASSEGNSGDGLPDDGVFPCNEDHPEVDLVDFDNNGNNCWKVTGTPSEISDVQNGQYNEVHVYASAGGAGIGSYAKFTLTFHYNDGSSELSSEFTVPDWYENNNIETGDRYFLKNGMDRYVNDGSGYYQDDNDPAIFGFLASSDASKTLTEITITVTENNVGTFGFFGGVATTETTSSTAPTANFTVGSSFVTGEEISFDASDSTDTDGSIVNYEWDWTNDGTYENSGINPTHSYSTAGTYTVKLCVTDNDGKTDTFTQEIVISAADITFTEETISNNTEEVHPDTDRWSVNISHPSGTQFNWWINTTPDIGSASGTSTSTNINPSCRFHDLQPYTTYTVHVTVRGSDHEQNYTFTTGGFSTNTSWHNSSTLNVTVEHEYPRILWYDIQKYTGVKTENDQQLPASTSEGDWVSIRNNMTEVDNATWLRVVLNVSSDQGWENIEFINISGWHDNGSDGDGSGYNRSGNHGSNRNFFLCYDNTSDGTAYYNKSWPKGSVEVTKGNMTERNVSDPLGISTTETRNLSFQFKPGYQFRYAPGPDGMGNTWMNHSVVNTEGYPSTDGAKFDYYTTCWEALNNSWSWNLNISITNKGMRGDESVSDYSSGFTSWVLDEFGVYSYTEIVSAGGDVSIHGAPGGNYSTNSSNPFNSESENVSLQTRSNGNYSLSLRIDDLLHNAASGLGYDRNSAPDHLILENDTIWVRGGTRSSRLNFSDELSRWWISLYGSCNDETGVATGFEAHEVNGTSKFAGETADDNENTGCLYPNDYNETMDAGNGLRAYNGLNSESHYVEFTCDIPLGAWAGKYSTHVYYHLQTEYI